MSVSQTFLRAGRPSYTLNDLTCTLTSRYFNWLYVVFFPRQWSHDTQHNSITCPLIVLQFGCNDENSKCINHRFNESPLSSYQSEVSENNLRKCNERRENLDDANNWRLIFCKCLQDVRSVQHNRTEVHAIRMLLESTPVGLRPDYFTLLTILYGETHEKINLFTAVEWSNMCNCIGNVVEHFVTEDKGKISFKFNVIRIYHLLEDGVSGNDNEIVEEFLSEQSNCEVKSSHIRIILNAVDWFRANGNIYQQILFDCSLPSQCRCEPLFHLLKNLNPLLWSGNFVNQNRVNDHNFYNTEVEKNTMNYAKAPLVQRCDENVHNYEVCRTEEKTQEEEEERAEQHVRQNQSPEELEYSKTKEKLSAMREATRSLWQHKIGDFSLFVIPSNDNVHATVENSSGMTNISETVNNILCEERTQISEESNNCISTINANSELVKNVRKRYVYAIYWQRPLLAKKEVDLNNYDVGPLSPQPISAELHLFTDRGDAFYIYQQLSNFSSNDFTFDDFLHEDGEVFAQLAPVEAINFDDIDRLLNTVAECKHAEMFTCLRKHSESCCSLVFPRVLRRTPTGQNVKANPLAKYHCEIKEASPSYEMVEDVISALRYINEHISIQEEYNFIASNNQNLVDYNLQDLCTIKTFNIVKRCAWCGRAREKMLRCAACGAVWYCSRLHQVSDWKEGNHKLECEEWKRAKQIYEENMNVEVTNQEEQEEEEESNSFSKSSIEEVLKEYCEKWTGFDQSKASNDVSKVVDGNVCSEGNAVTRTIYDRSVNKGISVSEEENCNTSEITKLIKNSEHFDELREVCIRLNNDKNILDNLHEEASSNENVKNYVSDKVIRVDACVGWSYAISTLQFVRQLLSREGCLLKSVQLNAVNDEACNSLDVKHTFCVHIVGIDVSVYRSFLWLLAACIDTIKYILLKTNCQIRIVLCSDTFTEFQRNEVWQVVEQVYNSTKPLCAVKKVNSTGVLGDTWREKQKRSNDTEEVSSSFVLVRLINTRYYLLHENENFNDKSNWPNAVISFGPRDGTGGSYFNASIETIVNHFLGHVPVRFVESSYIGSCRTRRAILARTGTSDGCDAVVKKTMENKSKQLRKAPMAININKAIITDSVLTGNVASILQSLNDYRTNISQQKENKIFDSCEDDKVDESISSNYRNANLYISRKISSNNNKNNDEESECTNSRGNDVNSMYVKKNGYYFDIMPFC